MGAGIQRTGEPQRIRGVADGGGIYQVALNAGPDRFWRSLFLDQEEYDTDFVPSLVQFSYYPPAANFQAEEAELKRRLQLLDAWLKATNRRLSPPPLRPAPPGESEPRRARPREDNPEG